MQKLCYSLVEFVFDVAKNTPKLIFWYIAPRPMYCYQKKAHLKIQYFFSFSNNYTKSTSRPNFKSSRLLHPVDMWKHIKNVQNMGLKKKEVCSLLYSYNQIFHAYAILVGC